MNILGSKFALFLGALNAEAWVIGNDAPAGIKTAATALKALMGARVQVATGTADDVAIQAALNALTASRTVKETCKLIGTFNTTAGVNIPSYTRFDMSDAVIKPSGGFHCLLNSDQTNGNSFIDVIGGLVDGTSQTGGGFGVFFSKASDSRTEGVEVKACSGNGIDVRSGSRVWVVKCYSHNNAQYGIDIVGMTDLHIEDNVVTSNTQRGIGSQATLSTRTLISGNTVSGNTQNGIEIGLSVADVDTVITGNVVTANANSGIAIGQTVVRTVISGNLIQGNGTTTAHQGILCNGSGTSIVGNTVRLNKGQGIDVGYASNCTVVGNQVEGNGTAAGGEVGINVEGGTGGNANFNTIVGNMVKDNSSSAQPGIFVHTTTGGATANDNIVMGNTVTGTHTYGVTVGDVRCARTLVKGNNLTGNATGAISDTGKYTIQSDNYGGDIITVAKAYTVAPFTTVGLTGNAALWTQPANTILLSATMVLDTQFAAAGMTSLTVSVGDAGNNTGILTTAGQNLTSDAVATTHKTKGAYFQATAGTLVQNAATAYNLYATAVGANLSTLTAGQVTFVFRYVQL